MYKNNSVHRRKLNENQLENGTHVVGNGNAKLSMFSIDMEEVSLTLKLIAFPMIMLDKLIPLPYCRFAFQNEMNKKFE